MSRSLTFEIPGKPLSLNRVSNASHWQSSNEKAAWRQAAAELVATYIKRNVQLNLPVDIEFTCLSKGRRMDSISPALAYKAVTDGVVDAGMLPNDSPIYVRRFVIHQPEKVGRDAIRCTLREV